MPRAYLSLVKSVMTQMGDVRAVQVLPMVAPRPLGQDVRYYLATHGGTPKPQSAAADSEQVLRPSNCPCVCSRTSALRVTASQERLGHDTKEEVATEDMMEKYLKAIGAWW